ncbi:UDP-glucose 4-epimerase GalE [Polyangium sp. y55x31]|uniref:UDP-glucose 4-epimerase GalE n=1 Tax=Polyangium sp. y55x31 TaxID=3042688 RepID=UPI00248278C5|nr:UDP-glucose 4-epimerase GalE [Polyangium sp. y55x31]MDI1475914.1 UDP-glucose 4-epimerase GalE [Polyangium sp. y55x31]
MRVFLTGGAGYIGSVVAEELVASGHEVIVYDDLSKGHRDAVIEEATFVEGDVLDYDTLLGALREHAVEAVVHMAARSLVGESVSHPADYYRTNVTGGLVLLEAMRAAGVSPIVFSSTAAVYGESAKQPIEETDPISPTNPYGETKLAYEHALRWFDRAYGIRYVSLRYFNAAGATARCGERHDPETHLIPLVLKVAAGELPEAVVFGDDYPTRDGTCVRDYIHVKDLARAHVLSLESLARGAESRIYNLGCGGEGYTVQEVIEVARDVSGRDIPVRKGPRRAGDPAVLVASSARIAEELGFRPALSDLREIVASAWSWMQAKASHRDAA